MERFNHKKLNDAEVREECRVNISNMFKASENLMIDDDDDDDISKALESIRIRKLQPQIV
jgi:hypothetical protein